MLTQPAPARNPARGAYRGRLAPSPTGLLHLGHARTFAIAAARARAVGGVLLLRIEDLDAQRSRPAYADAIVEDLLWLGLNWEKAPDVALAGPGACYLQSARRAFYLAAWRSLVERGWVYPCHCSRRELRCATLHKARDEDAGGNDEPFYPGTCRPDAFAQPHMTGLLPAPTSPSGVNWRFRVPDGERVSFKDGGFGLRSYVAGGDFGDFIVWRSDDVPAYQLAVVVDDAAMGITEVVRGADLLKSTARQLLLYRALGLAAPEWFHCSLVTDAEGRRFAKRNDALSIRDAPRFVQASWSWTWRGCAKHGKR